MLTDWRDRPLDDLLAAHRLDRTTEKPLRTDGWSGATFSTLEDDAGRRFVLKRTSLARDWIARATRDERLREGWFAVLAARSTVGLPSSTFPYLGAAADDTGDGVVILMPDLSAELIAWERAGQDPIVDADTVGRVVEALAELHRRPWAEREELADAPWTPLPERLTLLTRRSAAGYAANGNPVGARFLDGWDAFDRHAPAAARDLVERLGADPTPLVAALGRLPARGLHGDLKLANVALVERWFVGFIDWQMPLVAPVAVELGWLLVSNSASLPMAPKAVLAAYRQAVGAAAPEVLGDWEAQRDLTWIVGLLLRGWRKGLDADAGATLASGVTAADDLASWSTLAVEAADRRLP